MRDLFINGAYTRAAPRFNIKFSRTNSICHPHYYIIALPMT